MPRAEQEHRFTAARTLGRRAGRGGGVGVRRFQVRFCRRLPGLFLGRGEQGFLVEQSAHPVEPHFGGRMQPAEGAHPGQAARQDVLEEPSHEIQGLQLEGGVLGGWALAVVPAHLALGQEAERFCWRWRS